jgi:hypothetical protein
MSDSVIQPKSRNVPLGHWKTITFVAGLRIRAMVAPLVVEGVMNGPMFLAYVKQCLALRSALSAWSAGAATVSAIPIYYVH